ncbi:MAG TPA: hypothetical protein VFP65_28550, partial [Anaeromyxobacteraceae bacterium]|nr:hypothetical protein [Anaeromyxobacteraceae bacterium]
MRARAAAEWTGHALLALGAWLAFTQRLAPTELLAGVAAAAVSGFAGRLVWARNGATFRGE